MEKTRNPAPGLGATMVALVQSLAGAFFDRYRPELHYMRGPGPKWREKHEIAAARAGLAVTPLRRTTFERATTNDREFSFLNANLVARFRSLPILWSRSEQRKLADNMVTTCR
jgi:hypothetical protein